MNNIGNLLAQTPISNPAIPAFAGKTKDNAPELLGKFITGLIGVLLVVGTILALFQFFQGALEWITSGGDKTGLDNARNRITNALLGLVLIFAAWSLFLVIVRFLGINLVENGTFNFKVPSLL